MSDSPLLIPEQKVDLVLDMSSPALVLGGTVATAPQPLPSPLDHTTDVMVPDPMLPLELPGIRKVIQGERGPPGTRGARGQLGNKGNTGLSAYEDWLRRGNAGSFEDFLGAIGGGLNLEDFRSSLVDAVKDLIDPTLDAQLQQLVAMQMYLDAQILNARQEILNAANAAADAITAEQLARADAILAERMRMDANIASEAYARQDADQSVVNELKSWTAGYEGFSSVYSWNFHEDASGWENAHGQPMTVIDSPSTNDHGWGYTPMPDSTPMLKSPAALLLDVSTSTHVRVRVRKMGSPAWQGVLATQSGAVIATIPEPEWNDQKEATLTFEVPSWGDATGIQLLIQQDEAQTGNHFMYRYVAIGNTMPAASTALVHKEVSLVSDAVQSVATDQNLLAAQFRGGYTGNDINAVTEGLLFQERQARATQDTAIASDVTSLRARLDTGDVATAISSLTTNVTNLGDEIQAEAQRIDSVTATANGLSAQVTTQANALASTDGRLRAIRTVALNVNGHISGTVSENDGITSSFSVLADVFRVIGSANRGLEWISGALRAYMGSAQVVIGGGIGSDNLLIAAGPNVGASGATKANSSLSLDNAGNLEIRGRMRASLIESSAMALESLRLATGGGRYAPFTIRDGRYIVQNNTNASRTLTVDGFVSPNNGTGYHWKRFARNRMDIWLDAQISGDTGNETAILEVQYDGGAWLPIESVTFNCNYRGSYPILIRYTTVDSWSTVSFRVRTTQNRTEALRLTVDIANYNESGNTPGSSSGLTGGGGSAPPITGGPGGPGGNQPPPYNIPLT